MSVKGLDVKMRSWTRAVPCKTPDNIVSSNYTNAKAFVPSYEREKRPCIGQLLTNEYQRIWWQEKEVWDRMSTSKIPSKKLLQRMVIRKKPPVEATAAKHPRKVKTKKRRTKAAGDGKTRETEEKTAGNAGKTEAKMAGNAGETESKKAGNAGETEEVNSVTHKTAGETGEEKAECRKEEAAKQEDLECVREEIKEDK